MFAYYRGLLVDVSDYFAYYFYILSVISVGQFRRILRIFAPNILVRESYPAKCSTKTRGVGERALL